MVVKKASPDGLSGNAKIMKIKPTSIMFPVHSVGPC